MTINLYDILHEDELLRIKDSKCNIRNCKIIDITIEELQEIGLHLNVRDKFMNESIYPSITALKILLSRIRMQEHYER